MQPLDIKKYVAEVGLLHNAEVTLLGNGESNINYLAQDQEHKYVVRLTRSDVPSSSRFEKEHHFMLFIEALGIDFAPRSVHYDTARGIHITTHAAGSDASIADLNNAQTNAFVRQLKRLDSITYDAYLEWCNQNHLQPYAPQTVAMRNKINIDDRLQTIRSNADLPFAHEVLSWAEPKVVILKAAEAAANPQITFLHDDLRWNEGGGNLKVSDDKIVFIDWELSGFFEAVPEIGDVLGSIPNTIADKAVLHRLYKAYASGENDVEELNKKICYGVLWGKLGNPLWAAERYFILHGQKHSDTQRYRYLAELGMEDAEPFFAQPFEQWF